MLQASFWPPRVSAHIRQAPFRSPAQFPFGFTSPGVAFSQIARPAANNLIRNLNSIHIFKGFNKLQNARSFAGPQINHMDAGLKNHYAFYSFFCINARSCR